MPDCIWMLEIWTQVFRLQQQVLLPTEEVSPVPRCHFVCRCINKLWRPMPHLKLPTFQYHKSWDKREIVELSLFLLQCLISSPPLKQKLSAFHDRRITLWYKSVSQAGKSSSKGSVVCDDFWHSDVRFEELQWHSLPTDVWTQRPSYSPLARGLMLQPFVRAVNRLAL